MVKLIGFLFLLSCARSYAQPADLVDFGALTHFDAEFEVSLKDLVDDFQAGGSTSQVNIPVAEDRVKEALVSLKDLVPVAEDLVIRGTLHVNIPEEQIRVVAKTHLHTLKNQGAPFKELHAAIEIAFDGPKGYASVRTGDGLTVQPGKFDYQACTKVEFPQGLLPPPSVIKAQLKKQKPQVEMRMQTIPHFPLRIGDQDLNVFYYGDQGLFLAFHAHKGTPYAVLELGEGFWYLSKEEKDAIKKRIENGDLKPALVFTRWEKVSGVEDIPLVHCLQETLPAEGDLHRVLALAAADRVLSGLQGMLPLSSSAFAPLGVQPTALFKDKKSPAPYACSEKLVSSPSATSPQFSVTVGGGAVVAAIAALATLSVVVVVQRRPWGLEKDEARQYFQVA